MPRLSDPYRTLGVPRDATLPQIKAAHRALAKRYHPDAPTADQARFLSVQEAYQLLVDPLRRREWDARHAPAPMRADEPGQPGARPRGRRPAAGGREQAARSYTWSASEVPWWEEGARRSQRPGNAGSEPAGGTPRPPTAAGAAGEGTPPTERADFDVYNRSSGAAWSAAARAYFRRADQDLPRRGSFRYQGSQPLTAARARAAAEEEARRAGAQERAQQPSSGRPPGAEPEGGPNGTASTHGQGGANGQPRTDRQAAGHHRNRAAGPGSNPAPQATRPVTPRPRPAPPTASPDPEAGVARDAERISRIRARVRAEERAAHWPSRFQRLRYAVLAWAPVALLVGYGGPVLAECRPALDTCPDHLVAAQAGVALLVLAVLLLAPRAAYAGALATTALALAGGAALLGAWLVGVRAPQLAALPAWALVAGSVLLLGAYVLVSAWLAADRQRRPWAALRITRR
ncbi:MAG TPA: J domain-containing protein [Candidatus Limnocylindrales bacterium]|nr:J domain-containing protein [Candidatus Limnocylindrales bacterium]